jgi:WD40 repeat protein
MKTTKLFSLFALLFIAFSNMQFVSYAGDLAKDTVWTKRTTEGSFYSLQFINNDAVIVAQASGSTVFYDAFNSNEIRRLAGTNKALFFNQEKNFLRLNNDRKRFEIFDTESLEIIGELESDDLLMQEFSNYVISKDENFVVAVVTNGLRVWDLKTKKIIRTKIFETNNFLYKFDFSKLIFENGNILALTEKYYKDEKLQKQYSTYEIIKYSFETLDSIKNWGDKGYDFSVSNSGKYIAFGINGVEIYNLETGKLVSTIKTNNENITGIEFSKDERFIVTSGNTNSGFLQIGEVLTGKQFYLYTYGSISSFDLSKIEDFLISGSANYLLMWRVTELMTSINDNNIQTTIYPNPTNGKLEVKYQVQKPSIFQYEVTNIQGITLKRNNLGIKNIGQNIDPIDVNSIPSGIYNLRIYSENEQLNFKFIRGE